MQPTDSHGEPWSGRELSPTGYPDDDGSAPEALVAALVAGDRERLVTALLRERVLVPVVAVLDEAATGPEGRTTDKAAHMSVVTIAGADGRRALPVFTATSALVAWDPTARPVPVSGVAAARAAYEDGAEAMLVDPAGPHRRVLDGPLLRALADGRAPVRPLDDPEVRVAVTAAARATGLAPEAVRLRPGVDVDVVVELVLAADAPDDEAARAGVALGRALSADPVLRSRLGRGLDLALVREEASSRHAGGV